MNKIINIFFAIAMIGVLTVTDGHTQSAPVKAWVSADKNNYIYNGEPVNITITLENDSGGEVITPVSLENKPFHLLLKFIDRDESVITTHESGDLHSPPTPDQLDEDRGDGRYRTVEKITRWPAGPMLVTDPFDAYTYYPLRPFKGTVEVNTSTRFIAPGNVFTDEGEEYTNIVPGPGDTADRLRYNKFPLCIKADIDNDGYYKPACLPAEAEDCDDDNINVNPGVSEILGNGIDDDCNYIDTPDVISEAEAIIDVQADIHTVGDTGNRPASNKAPAQNMHVRLFDKSSPCVTNYGVSWKFTEQVWLYCPDLGSSENGWTDDTGKVSFKVSEGEEIFLIGEYVAPDAKKIYVGRNLGAAAAGVKDVYAQIIVTPDGVPKSGKYRKENGSVLLIIEPEYVEWDGTQEYYPFIFESVGDWTVTTAVTPPEGFVADADSLMEDVNTELEAVQFLITDVGSKWVDTEVIHTVKHKGKTKKIKSKIGIKCSKKLAKEKGFDKFCQKIKEKLK